MQIKGIARSIFTVAVLLFVVAVGTAYSAQGDYQLVPGFSLPAITTPIQSQHLSAFPLLQSWKNIAQVRAIETYDPGSGSMLRAELDIDGMPQGSNFPLQENTALFVYADGAATVPPGVIDSCPNITLTAGLNLFGYTCPPANYSAAEMLVHLGQNAVSSISRFDTRSQKWLTVAFSNDAVVGDDFPIVTGEGYMIYMASAVSSWTPPLPAIASLNPPRITVNQLPVKVEVNGGNFSFGSVVMLNDTLLNTVYVNDKKLAVEIPTQAVAGNLPLTVKRPEPLHVNGYVLSNTFQLPVKADGLTFSPDVISVRQGDSGVILGLMIPSPAPAGGLTVLLFSSDVSVLNIPSSVYIPAGATAITVPLTPLVTGNIVNMIVTVTASNEGYGSGQAKVEVRPSQNQINLSPQTILTGKGFTYLLSVESTDPAPTGGLTVNLSAVPPGIVSLPSAVTIPGGGTKAQVTVTALELGTTVVSGVAPGVALTGMTSTVTVDNLYSEGFTPLTSASIGIQVLTPAQPLTKDVTYTPVLSSEVGVVVGSVQTGMIPHHGVAGSGTLGITISGTGLAAVSGVSFIPDTGITILPGSLVATADGMSVTFMVTIAADAPLGERTVILQTGSGAVPVASKGVNLFRVTHDLPEILSLIPNYGVEGTVMSLQLNGRNLFEALSVAFIPAEGIHVGYPPVVSSDGKLATVQVGLDSAAVTGDRVVTITSQAGTTTTAASAANTFAVRTAALPGTPYAGLASLEVGVLVPTTTLPPPDATYTPVLSLPVGIVTGSALTAVAPHTAAIGVSGLKLQALGPGLETATGITFIPDTGITIIPGSFVVGVGGIPEVTVNIAEGAPLGERLVIVTLPSGSALPAGAGANLFRVTLPQPAIASIQPITREVGSSFTLTVAGVNLANATSINFVPADGFFVQNPPIANASGTMLTASVSMAANASIGQRVVTVTTAGGASPATPLPANIFTVTAVAGDSYTSLLSLPVGVTVAPPADSTPPASFYGPVSSTEVGVYVTLPADPATVDVPYGPLASLPVGVAVGSSLAAVSPLVVLPGSSTTLTLTGAGLSGLTAVEIVPASGLTVSGLIVAGDGLSATVTITVAADASTGMKTVLARAGTASIPVASPYANRLLVGAKPVVNSIFPLLPSVGSSFTLTINGVNLSEATNVAIFPADGVQIDTKPVYVVDETGEHLKVQVVIDPNATPGDRIVVVTTLYGSSSAVGSEKNIITFFKPSAMNDNSFSGVVTAATGEDDIPFRAEPDRRPLQLSSLQQETAVLPRSYKSAPTIAIERSSVSLPVVVTLLPLWRQWWGGGIVPSSTVYRGPPDGTAG